MGKIAKIFKQKKFVIGGIVLVAVLIAGGVSWVIWQDKKQSSTEHSHVDAADEVSTAVLEARQYIDEQNVQAGAAYYDEKIKGTHDKATLQSLYIAKVDYLLQAKDPAAAVEAAKKAVTNNADDAFGHAALARAYEANSQPQEALAAYKAALARLQGGEIIGRSNPRLMFEQKIKELES